MKALLVVVIVAVLAVLFLARRKPWIYAIIGLPLLVIGQGYGLFWAPPEQHMQDVGRILYCHVPAAWVGLVAYTAAFAGALGSLFASDASRPWARLDWDALLEAAIEVGAVLNVLLLVTGSIFARPTWGWWWDWYEPRLTSSAMMLVSFVSILLLRSLVDDVDRRALWSAVATILAFVNIPVVYMSVRWFRSLHQVQSTPFTMDGDMVFVLRINAFAFLFLAAWMIGVRWKMARARAEADSPPPLPVTPEEAPR